MRPTSGCAATSTSWSRRPSPPAEVRTILQYQIDFFTKQGVTQNGETPHLAADVVIGLSETVAYIVDRTKADGDPLLSEQVYPVVETQLAYLRAIGAVGPSAN